MNSTRSFSHNLGLIVFVAFILRIAGIGFGLPQIYHQDEPVIVNHAMAIGERGWNPHFFVLPSFTIYFLFLLYAAFFVVGHWLGQFPDKAHFAILFLKNPTTLYLIGRFSLGAVFGTATVGMLGYLGKKFFGERIGLLAAVFLALCYLHAVHSHYIYADISLTFFVTWFCYCLLDILERPTVKGYLVAGAVLGLAMSAKYTAAYFVPGIVFFLIWQHRGSPVTLLKNILLAASAAGLSYLIVAPYTFLAWPEFLQQVARQSGSEKHLGFLHHFSYSLMQTTSPVFIPLAVIGAVAVFQKAKKETIFFLSVFFIYYLINVFFSQPFARYMMPVLPVLAIFAAYGADGLFRQCARLHRALPLVVGLGLFLSMLIPILYADYLFLKKDTRDQCQAWIKKNAKPASVIVLDNRFYAPHLHQTAAQIKAKEPLLKGKDEAKKKRLELTLRAWEREPAYEVFTLLRIPDQEQGAFLFEHPFVKMDETAINEIRAEYLIINYSEYQASIEAFKNSLGPRLRLVAQFSPYRQESRKRMMDVYSSTAAPDSIWDLFNRRRLGPYLEVYQIARE